MLPVLTSMPCSPLPPPALPKGLMVRRWWRALVAPPPSMEGPEWRLWERRWWPPAAHNTDARGSAAGP